MLQERIWLKWNLNDIIWSNNPYLWSEVYIVQVVTQGISQGGGGGSFSTRKNKVWTDVRKQIRKAGIDDETASKFLEIVVKVNDVTNKEVRELSEKDLNKMITVEHIKNTISMVAPDVKVVTVRVDKKNNK